MNDPRRSSGWVSDRLRSSVRSWRTRSELRAWTSSAVIGWCSKIAVTASDFALRRSFLQQSTVFGDESRDVAPEALVDFELEQLAGCLSGVAQVSGDGFLDLLWGAKASTLVIYRRLGMERGYA